MSDEIRVSIHGQSFLLNAAKTAYWEEESILLCSDLHWGREAFLQSRGFPVPEGVFDEESFLLGKMIERYQSRRVFVLGDLIHHPAGMHVELRSKIRRWTEQYPKTEVRLIPGNHDRAINEWLPECGITLGDSAFISSGIRLCHEARAEKKTSGEFTWQGHQHPAIRIPEVSDYGKFPAFYVKKNIGYLPAFSQLAGGSEIKHFEAGDQIFAVSTDHIFAVPNRGSRRKD
ncbi:MAG: ligase-associated DNA damage response endonuclease PdeM [Cryobacterium sp.]|nr:ligase-associated DNA damage response endonuclease PdeM [Oligoflexia bacterium]